MPTDDRGVHKTLQDDRTALGTDIGDESPLVKGEGAPLADDAAMEAKEAEKAPPPATAPAFLGGMPIPAPVEGEFEDRAPGHGMTTAEDRPIDD
jgi:hypothetical protein